MIQQFKEKAIMLNNFFQGHGYNYPTDLIGYESILTQLEKNNILSVKGDFLEIGAFLGGGTAKLSAFLSKNKSTKKLFVIDIFDPSFDWTKNLSGQSMCTFYEKVLKTYKGKTQFEVFSQVTSNCKNITVYKSDSVGINFSHSLCFALIDGNHDPKYVENDFNLVWSHLTSGGLVALHDYDGDLPLTTAKINELIKRHSAEIKCISKEKEKWLIYIIKA